MQKLNLFESSCSEIMINKNLCEQNIGKGYAFGGDGSIQTALRYCPR